MKKLSVFPVALAAFIGGIAFIVSCGGGSSSGVIGLNTAIANVPTEQMFCRSRAGSPLRPDSQVDNCFDTNGNNYGAALFTISELWADGWRSQNGVTTWYR
jgi:hypothetical protein